MAYSKPLSIVPVVAACVAGCGVTAVPSDPARPAPRPYLNMPPDGRGAVPQLLSETGAFADVTSLTPTPGLVPYEVNVPFWADGADKTRWAAVPHGPIRFSADGEWGFPAGTV